MEFTSKQAAAYLGITCQALYLATRSGRIKCTGNHFKKYVKTDLDKYKASKYSRAHHFDEKFMSVKEAAELLGIKLMKAYYMIHIGEIEADYDDGMYLIDRQKFKSVIKRYEAQVRRKANDKGREEVPQQA